MNKNTAQAWLVYTDGASRGNPGIAGCGAAISSPEGEEYEYTKFLGEMTNNQAEYHALILALENLTKLGAKNIILRADSELMVKQLKGEYRVKHPNIIPLFKTIKKLLLFFTQVKFEHVKRENNKIADKLANQAIDDNLPLAT